jgi:hypothetical protein
MRLSIFKPQTANREQRAARAEPAGRALMAVKARAPGRISVAITVAQFSLEKETREVPEAQVL